MNKNFIQDTTLTDIADAIRSKKLTSNLIQVSNFANEIYDIVAPQYEEMPEPSESFFKRIIQYVGDTDNNYIHGYFYECKSYEEIVDYDLITFYYWDIIEITNAKGVFYNNDISKIYSNNVQDAIDEIVGDIGLVLDEINGEDM